MPGHSPRLVALACAFFLLNASFPAGAQTPVQAPAACPNASRAHPAPSPQRVAARKAMRQACAADETQFCANVPARCGQRRQCMMANAAQLSPTCASAIRNLRATR